METIPNEMTHDSKSLNAKSTCTIIQIELLVIFVTVISHKQKQKGTSIIWNGHILSLPTAPHKNAAPNIEGLIPYKCSFQTSFFNA